VTAPAPLRYYTAGESHGKGLVVFIDGLPAWLKIAEADVDADLARRQKGHGRGKRQRIERDRVEVLGGLYEGTTTGAPLALWIRNLDWENVKDSWPPPPVTVCRPGHVDYAGCMKYEATNIRRVWERSSARETAARVAAGAVAKVLARELAGVRLLSHVVRIGDVVADEAMLAGLSDEQIAERAGASPVRCADAAAAERMVALIDATKKEGDTLGGCVEVRAVSVPVGLGSYVQHDRRLEARIGAALLSIPSAKGVEIGDAVKGAGDKGSRVHDQLEPPAAPGEPPRFLGNRAGGIEGGITNGQTVWARVWFKPIATVPKGLASIDLATGEAARSVYLRSDTCVVPAAGVICEAAVAWELAVALRERCAGDTVAMMKRALAGAGRLQPRGASHGSEGVEGGET